VEAREISLAQTASYIFYSIQQAHIGTEIFAGKIQKRLDKTARCAGW